MNAKNTNHWLDGSEENKKVLLHIAETALSSGKLTAELPLKCAFRNIDVATHNQSSLISAVDEELDNLKNHRNSFIKNPFWDLSNPFTPEMLAERFSKAFFSDSSDEVYNLFLKAVVDGNKQYYDLVHGVCWEFQKTVLVKLKKLGFRFWDKNKGVIVKFINGGISFNEINFEVKRKVTEDENLNLKEVELNNNSSLRDEIRGLLYFGFECKSHIKKEQLLEFHNRVIQVGYFKKSSLHSQFEEEKEFRGFKGPTYWLSGNGRLVYLFTRLSEVAFVLPQGTKLPPNALVKEYNLANMDVKSKIQALQLFSKWLNKTLIHSFRNEIGEKYTTAQLKQGKKDVLKQENENSKWKVEIEDLLLIFQ